MLSLEGPRCGSIEADQYRKTPTLSPHSDSSAIMSKSRSQTLNGNLRPAFLYFLIRRSLGLSYNIVLASAQNRGFQLRSFTRPVLSGVRVKLWNKITLDRKIVVQATFDARPFP
jgi:hypothetical protein